MPTINVSDETYEAIKDQLGTNERCDVSDIADMVGKCFFFRTVNFHMVGRVETVIGRILKLSDASWVADSGRFMGAIKNGTLNEVEPVGTWFVNLDGTPDFGPWNHELLRSQK